MTRGDQLPASGIEHSPGRVSLRSPVLAARALIFVLVCGFLLWSPIDRHLRPFGKPNPYTHGWMFFHGYGKGVCDVEFNLHTAEGTKPLDRYETLGFERSEAPDWLLKIRNGKNARVPLKKVVRRVCDALGSRSSELRVGARCAGYNGWKQVLSSKRPACSAARNKKKKKRAAAVSP